MSFNQAVRAFSKITQGEWLTKIVDMGKGLEGQTCGFYTYCTESEYCTGSFIGSKAFASNKAALVAVPTHRFSVEEMAGCVGYLHDSVKHNSDPKAGVDLSLALHTYMLKSKVGQLFLNNQFSTDTPFAFIALLYPNGSNNNGYVIRPFVLNNTGIMSVKALIKQCKEVVEVIKARSQ